MALVQVILSEDVHNLGDAGDVVKVKPGFARNFLIPQGKALPATAARVHEVEHKRRVIAEKRSKELKDLESVKTRIEGIALAISAQVGEEGKLFGSVTSANLAELLGAQGVEVDRRKIVLVEPIKSVGEHTVTVRLRNDVVASLKVTVTAAS
ncbi:MAG: 50S ribosomal protein L9 [Deltaproteobacteria bacterium]|nr:50S ribosomal protein L9 [Deltaproteobacteria bacterium]